jgi:phage terminase large subunit-like protein
MSRRKALAEMKGRIGPEAAKRRAQAEIDAARHASGYPIRPQGLPRAARDLWNRYCALLHEQRLLATDDAELMLQLVNAQLAGDAKTTEAIAKIFKARQPFEEPAAEPEPAAAPVASLVDFLAGVAEERSSFSDRLLPDKTVCLDANGAEYLWPEGDAAEVARRYALEVTQGKRVAGELLRRACNRFLQDLELGAERGVFFDPVAARHIVQFAEVFCKLRLMSWQVFVLANVFGFKRASGARRFTEAFISIARKNGKTRLASVVALWLLVCDQEKFPEIYAAATKKEQSRIVWKDARRTVGESAELSAYVKRWAHELTVPLTDGMFVPLASEEKSLDGLRVHGAIADELHAWVSRDVWDRLVKATVSRVQPLIWGITTAGESKQSFCWNKQDLAEKILNGIYHEDSTFVCVYRLDKEDDYRDDSLWAKANPSLENYEILKPEHLKKALGEVEQDPSGLNAFLRFHMNIWPDITLSRQNSIPAAKWDACAGLDLIGEKSPLESTLKFLRLNTTTPCYAGLDVGLTSDMSCFSLLYPRGRFAEGAEPIEKKVLIAQFFMPEVGLLAKERAWQVPLSQWAREGWIQLLPGDMTDPREIRKYILEMSTRVKVYELGFDTWNAQVLCAELNEGGAVRCVAVPQTAKELTAPAREFLTAMHNKELVHFGNPVMAWHAGNVVLAEDEKHGGTKPEKLSPDEKIDGISATLNAWHRMLASPIFESVYSKRGLILL